MPIFCVTIDDEHPGSEKLNDLMMSLALVVPGFEIKSALRVTAPASLTAMLLELGAEAIGFVSTGVGISSDEKPKTRKKREPKTEPPPASGNGPTETARHSDARFSEPTIFTDDRAQNNRILTRHQQPIRGRREG